MGAFLSVEARNRKRYIRQLAQFKKGVPNCMTHLESLIETDRLSLADKKSKAEAWYRQHNAEVHPRIQETFTRDMDILDKLEIIKDPVVQLVAEVDYLVKMAKCSKCGVSIVHLSDAAGLVYSPGALIGRDLSTVEDMVLAIKTINRNYSDEHLVH